MTLVYLLGFVVVSTLIIYAVGKWGMKTSEMQFGKSLLVCLLTVLVGWASYLVSVVIGIGVAIFIVPVLFTYLVFKFGMNKIAPSLTTTKIIALYFLPLILLVILHSILIAGALK